MAGAMHMFGRKFFVLFVRIIILSIGMNYMIGINAVEFGCIRCRLLEECRRKLNIE